MGKVGTCTISVYSKSTFSDYVLGRVCLEHGSDFMAIERRTILKHIINIQGSDYQNFFAGYKMIDVN